MIAGLKAQGRYAIPPSPRAATTQTFDIVRSGSAMANGTTEWFPVAISQKPTQLPEQTRLGDVTRMVVSPFKRGWLVTPAVPKNEFWEFLSQGMLGPAMDLMMPGLNAVLSSAIHGAIDTAMEDNETAKYFRRTLDGFFSLPYLDVLEVDWREMGSVWSLSLQGPVRHLTVVYADAQGQRSTITLVGGFSFANWVKQIFGRRYACEVEAEHQAAIDSFVEPGTYAGLFATFSEQHPAGTSPEDLNALLTEFARTRMQYLTDHGISEETIRTRSLQRCTAALERYRGLPEYDEFLRAFIAKN